MPISIYFSNPRSLEILQKIGLQPSLGEPGFHELPKNLAQTYVVTFGFCSQLNRILPQQSLNSDQVTRSEAFSLRCLAGHTKTLRCLRFVEVPSRDMEVWVGPRSNYMKGSLTVGLVSSDTEKRPLFYAFGRFTLCALQTLTAASKYSFRVCSQWSGRYQGCGKKHLAKYFSYFCISSE